MPLNLKTKLEKIVGKENVTTNSEDLKVYSYDASENSGKPKMVVWPKTVEEISRIVELANQENISIVARGGGTSLCGGAVPIESIVLDMTHMNKVLEVEQGEFVATAESGIILDKLNEYLTSYGLMFPVQPSTHTVSTLGGAIAPNAAGIKAIKYGKTNKWIEELEVVDGTGRAFKTKKIMDFCGTEGTLGVITKAKVKLTKPPEEISLTMYMFDSIEKLMDKVFDVKKRDDVLAIEFVSSIVADFSGFEKTNYLLVQFDGDAGEITDEKEIAKIWEIREGAFSIMCSHDYPVLGDPQVPLDRMTEFLEELKKRDIPSFGHIGVGIIHPHFKKDQQTLREEIIKLAIELGGKASGEHGIGLSKKEFVPEEEVERIKKLKERYDPNNIMNRGKII